MRARLEALLIRAAAHILLSRCVKRAMAVSRRDNNAMFEMGWKLRDIARRIETKYEEAA